MNCSDCQDTGYLLDQGYGCADIPDGWIPVQACDNCRIYNAESADEDAARAAAANFNVAVEWYEPDPVVVGDEFFDAGPGDWAINFPGPNLKRFKLEYKVTEMRAAHVWAESESAARQCWIDDVLDKEWVEDIQHEMERVYEDEPA